MDLIPLQPLNAPSFMFFRLDLKIISFIFLHPANDIVSIVSRLQGNDTEAMSEFSKAFAQILLCLLLILLRNKK